MYGVFEVGAAPRRGRFGIYLRGIFVKPPGSWLGGQEFYFDEAGDFRGSRVRPRPKETRAFGRKGIQRFGAILHGGSGVLAEQNAFFSDLVSSAVDVGDCRPEGADLRGIPLN